MLSSQWRFLAHNGLRPCRFACIHSNMIHIQKINLHRSYASKPLHSSPNPVIRKSIQRLESIFARPISWWNTVKQNYEKLSDKINNNSQWRNWYSVAMFALYSATGVLAYRYLVETKYKATGEDSPYKSAEVDREENIDEVEPRDTTEVYEKMAKEYDSKIWKEEFFSYIWYLRRKLSKKVQGNVLEVSCGTGRNIKYLKMNEIKSIVFLDSSRAMLEVAKSKFDRKYPDYKSSQWVQGRAEDLENIAEKSGQKFDTIFESFGLCSHEDPVGALKSFKKLLKKGGRIILLEHGRSYNEKLNNTMDKRAAKRMEEWGCRWNLDIREIIRKSGLTIEEEARYHFGTTYFYVCK